MREKAVGSEWNKRNINPNNNNLISAAPYQWSPPKNLIDGAEKTDPTYLLDDDIRYIESRIRSLSEPGYQGSLARIIQPVGRAAGGVRILQTALDWAPAMINGPMLFGYDMYRANVGLAASPLRLVGIKIGEPSAFPLIHPLMKAAGMTPMARGTKSSSVFGEAFWQAGASFVSQKETSKFWLREQATHPEIMAAYQKYARVAGLPHELAEFGWWEAAEKRLLGKIPIAKDAKLFQRYQRGFTSYLNAGSWEYFKSQYHMTNGDPDNLEQLGTLSKNLIGMHAGAELGIGKTQLAGERIGF
ncbi:MAG: hypothetical protein QQN63_14000, partial [Nitrosopumilus sp.]